MRNLVLSAILIFGLAVPISTSHAQDTNTVTAICKDGTPFSGTKRSGACRGHGGVQSWGTAASPAAPSQAPTAAATPTPSQQTPTTTPSSRAAPSGTGVWVNTASKVYHCPGTR